MSGLKRFQNAAQTVIEQNQTQAQGAKKGIRASMLSSGKDTLAEGEELLKRRMWLESVPKFEMAIMIMRDCKESALVVRATAGLIRAKEKANRAAEIKRNLEEAKKLMEVAKQKQNTMDPQELVDLYQKCYDAFEDALESSLSRRAATCLERAKKVLMGKKEAKELDDLAEKMRDWSMEKSWAQVSDEGGVTVHKKLLEHDESGIPVMRAATTVFASLNTIVKDFLWAKHARKVWDPHSAQVKELERLEEGSQEVVQYVTEPGVASWARDFILMRRLVKKGEMCSVLVERSIEWDELPPQDNPIRGKVLCFGFVVTSTSDENQSTVTCFSQIESGGTTGAMLSAMGTDLGYLDASTCVHALREKFFKEGMLKKAKQQLFMGTQYLKQEKYADAVHELQDAYDNFVLAEDSDGADQAKAMLNKANEKSEAELKKQEAINKAMQQIDTAYKEMKLKDFEEAGVLLELAGQVFATYSHTVGMDRVKDAGRELKRLLAEIERLRTTAVKEGKQCLFEAVQLQEQGRLEEALKKAERAVECAKNAEDEDLGETAENKRQEIAEALKKQMSIDAAVQDGKKLLAQADSKMASKGYPEAESLYQKALDQFTQAANSTLIEKAKDGLKRAKIQRCKEDAVTAVNKLEAKLIELSQDSQGWVTVEETASKRVEKKDPGGEEYTIYRAVGSAEVPGGVVMTDLWPLESRRDWDPAVHNIDLIERLDQSTEILHVMMEAGSVASDREFVVCRRRFHRSNNVNGIVEVSCESPLYPENDNPVRGTLFIGGFVWTCSDGSGAAAVRTKLCGISQVDVGGHVGLFSSGISGVMDPSVWIGSLITKYSNSVAKKKGETLLMDAEALMLMGKYADAVNRFREAAQAFDDGGDHEDAERARKGLEEAQKSLEEHEEKSNAKTKADGLVAGAEKLIENDKHHDAIKVLEEALGLYRKAEEPECEKKTNEVIAAVRKMIAEVEAQARALQEAKQLEKSGDLLVGNKNHEAAVSAFGDAEKKYAEAGDKEGMKRTNKKKEEAYIALTAEKEKGEMVKKAHDLMQHGDESMQSGNTRDAMDKFLQAASLFHAATDPENEKIALEKLELAKKKDEEAKAQQLIIDAAKRSMDDGDIFTSQNKFDKAEEAYLEAKGLWDKAGNVPMAQKAAELARDAAHKSEEASRKPQLQREAENAIKKGLVAMEGNPPKYDDALEMFELAERLFLEAEDDVGAARARALQDECRQKKAQGNVSNRANALMDEADLKMQQGDYGAAESLYGNAAKLFEEAGDSPNAASAKVAKSEAKRKKLHAVYLQMVKDMCDKLRVLAEDPSEDWEDISDSWHVNCGVKVAKNSSLDVTAVRANALIDGAETVIVSEVWPLECRMKFDKMCLDAKKIERIDDDTEIARLVIKAGELMSDREFILVRATREVNGHHVVVEASVERDEFPSDSDPIRGYCELCGFVVSKVEGNDELSNVTCVAQVDAGGVTGGFLGAMGFGNVSNCMDAAAYVLMLRNAHVVVKAYHLMQDAEALSAAGDHGDAAEKYFEAAKIFRECEDIEGAKNANDLGEKERELANAEDVRKKGWGKLGQNDDRITKANILRMEIELTRELPVDHFWQRYFDITKMEQGGFHKLRESIEAQRVAGRSQSRLTKLYNGLMQ